VATQLQSEGVAVTHDVFVGIKATVDFTKEILEKGRVVALSLMTCLELALTAQLICLADGTPVCTDNGSVAQLLGLPCLHHNRGDPTK
jgi:hypothetical protein